MTYRIQVGSGEKKGQWVRPYNDGSFEYVTYDQAAIFPSRFVAETALQTRWSKDKGAPAIYAGDFKIVESPTSMFAKIESTPGTSRQQSYHFIGGPKDGVQLILQDGPPEYYFPIAPRLQGIYDAGISLYGSVDTGHAVYLRLPIGVNPANQQPAQRYTVYVFSHVEGLMPRRPGEKIMFENRVWTISDISWRRSPTEVRFEARTSGPGGQARLSGDTSSLYYEWPRETWCFKPKSVVEVDETRTVVVA